MALAQEVIDLLNPNAAEFVQVKRPGVTHDDRVLTRRFGKARAGGSKLPQNKIEECMQALRDYTDLGSALTSWTAAANGTFSVTDPKAGNETHTGVYRQHDLYLKDGYIMQELAFGYLTYSNARPTIGDARVIKQERDAQLDTVALEIIWPNLDPASLYDIENDFNDNITHVDYITNPVTNDETFTGTWTVVASSTGLAQDGAGFLKATLVKAATTPTVYTLYKATETNDDKDIADVNGLLVSLDFPAKQGEVRTYRWYGLSDAQADALIAIIDDGNYVPEIQEDALDPGNLGDDTVAYQFVTMNVSRNLRGGLNVVTWKLAKGQAEVDLATDANEDEMYYFVTSYHRLTGGEEVEVRLYPNVVFTGTDLTNFYVDHEAQEKIAVSVKATGQDRGIGHVIRTMIKPLGYAAWKSYSKDHRIIEQQEQYTYNGKIGSTTYYPAKQKAMYHRDVIVEVDRRYLGTSDTAADFNTTTYSAASDNQDDYKEADSPPQTAQSTAYRTARGPHGIIYLERIVTDYEERVEKSRTWDVFTTAPS